MQEGLPKPLLELETCIEAFAFSLTCCALFKLTPLDLAIPSLLVWVGGLGLDVSSWFL